MRYALRFGYDGTLFQGYARQPGMKTVEGSVLDVLHSEGIIESEQNFRSASRTDKGVSAIGNVMVVRTPVDRRGIVPLLNSKLEGVFFHGIAEVAEDFNPRHAVMRWYRYFLLDDERYNENLLIQYSNVFLGEHDFFALAKSDDREENTRLILDSIDIKKQDGFIVLDFRARRFLWQMVRRIVSALLEMHDRKILASEVLSTLESGKDKLALNPVSPVGLVLMDIDFGIEFERIRYSGGHYEKAARESVTRARVLGEISGGAGKDEHHKDY